MSNLAEQQQLLRPRNRSTRRKFRAGWIVAAALMAVVGLLATMFGNLVAKEQKALQIREPYSWGPVLLVDLKAGGIASNFLELENKLSTLKETGFKTLVLPIIHDSDEVLIGEKVLFAPKSWEILNSSLGTEKQLTELIDAAHKNEQKILFTLSAGWISKTNPWYIGNAPAFYDQRRTETFLKRNGLDTKQFEGLAMPNPIKFDASPYLKTVGVWVKKYNIDGVFIDSPYAVRKDLDREALGRIKDEFSVTKDFITMSSNISTPSASRSPYSATFSDFVEQVFAPVSSDFNADNFALSLKKQLVSKNGPIPLNPIWLATPNYLNQALGNSQILDSAIAFAYLAPGVPVVNSVSLLDTRLSKQIYELNDKFRDILKSRNENLEFSAKFFVAQSEGVVAFRYQSNKENYVIVLNTTSEKLDAEKIEVPASMTGKYANLLTKEIQDVSESWTVSLEPNSINVLTGR